MERITRFRAIVMFLIVCALMIFLAGRLYYLQIVETGGVVDNTTTFTTATRVKAARGSITDRNGNVLVGNRASYDLVLNHYVLTNSENPNQSLYDLVELCRELGIEYTEHLPLTKTAPFQYTLSEYSSSWQRYFQMFLENRDLDSDITAPLLFEELRNRYDIPEEWSDADARAVLGLRYELSLRALSGTGLSNYVFQSDVDNDSLAAISELNIPGMNVEASTVREYYTTYAAHVLGYVGSMSPSQWEHYQNVDTNGDGSPDYLMDAEVGQAGFEQAFEEYLHGIDGWRYDEVTADGTTIRTWYDPAPVAGSNVEVTLDLNCQIAAEEEMARLFQELAAKESGSGHDVEGGAVVAMDVRTGQILVCASYPTYDPTAFFSSYNDLLAAENNPLLNRALMGLYAPGSTYKMSMVVSAIDSGTINSLTEIEDKGRWWLSDDFYLSCMRYSSSGTTHGAINAAEALKFSCNYFFYQLGHWMDPDVTDATAKGLGLGEDTGVEVFEYTGYRANAETKQKLYSEENWGFYEPDRLQSSIGQSDNRFTPLQLCVYASTLANQGVRYRATFLNQVVSADYRELIYKQLQDVVSTMPISDEAYNSVVTGMKMVAHESGGTGYSTFRDYPITIAAKTGTAQTGITGASDNGAFVCFAPADNPQIAIAVYGEKAGGGSSVASIAKAILDAYFQVGTEGEYSEIQGENELG
ncbi:MAG: hypothetical protein IKC09_05480 [Oscillospiraceae bacterium]|nr:hypothetical protein [Oscillospiraceae bacterium]